jgi:hypothetical protein
LTSCKTLDWYIAKFSSLWLHAGSKCSMSPLAAHVPGNSALSDFKTAACKVLTSLTFPSCFLLILWTVQSKFPILIFWVILITSAKLCYWRYTFQGLGDLDISWGVFLPTAGHIFKKMQQVSKVSIMDCNT